MGGSFPWCGITMRALILPYSIFIQLGIEIAHHSDSHEIATSLSSSLQSVAGNQSGHNVYPLQYK